MRILLSGAHGFLGSQLSSYFSGKGHTITPLVRSRKESGIYFSSEEYNANDLEGFDLIIHLAGEPIFGLWTKGKKKAIYDSRVVISRALCEAISQLTNPPKLYIQASATGYYGDQGDLSLTVNSGSGEGFLAKVCRDWEKTAGVVQAKGINTLLLRTGVVLGNRGFLPLHKKLHNWCLGAILGTGKQCISWIHIEDWLRALDHSIEHGLSGSVNFTSAAPTEQKELAKELSSLLHRPLLFRIPKWFLLCMASDLAREVLLSSTKAIPEKLIQSGFTFNYSSIRDALSSLCNPTKKA